MFKPIESTKTPTTLKIPEYFATFLESKIESKELYYYINLSFNIERQEIQKNLDKLKIKIYKNDQINNLNLSDIEVFAKKQELKILEETIFLKDYLSSKKRRVLKRIDRPSFDKSLLFNDQVIPQQLKYKNLSIIKNLKLDPSEAILNHTKQTSNPIINDLLNHYLFYSIGDLEQQSEYFSVIENDKIGDKIYFNKIIKINQNQLSDNRICDISFELYSDLNPNQLLFEEETRNINLNSLLDIKRKKLSKPSIIGSSVNRYNQIVINQNDANVETVLLQEKTISNNHISSYSIKANNLEFEETTSYSFSYGNQPDKIQIYRCIANPNTNLSTHKNIIIGNIPFIDATKLTISNDKQKNAVSIQLREAPLEAQEFQVLKVENNSDNNNNKAITKFLPLNKGTTGVIYDRDVISGKYYEYKIAYKMIDGTIKNSVSKIHKFLDTSNAKKIQLETENNYSFSTTEIEGKKVGQVSFSINATFLSEQNNVIVDSLNSFVGENFSKEFKKLKDNFQDIIFFKVTRINLSVSPIVEEEFPQTFKTGDNFEDNVRTQNMYGISRINLDHEYEYQIRAFYKNPTTLLKHYFTEVPTRIRGSNVRKMYRYKPYKWLQKRSLNTGTLSAQNENGDLIEDSFLEDGDIGVIASIKTQTSTINNTQITRNRGKGINNQLAIRKDLRTIQLEWTIENEEEYDHFVIVKESNKVRKILTTTISTNYIDNLELNDVGTIVYYITPVLNDYNVGPTVKTSNINVDPEEFDGAF